MAALSDFLAQMVTLTGVFAVLWILEAAFPKERQSVTSRLRAAVFWVIETAFTAGATVGFFLLWRALGIRPLAIFDLTGLGPVVGVLFAAILGDFAFYWMHRAQHAWFWRFHAVHHAIEEMNAVSSYQHISEGFFRAVFILAPGSLFVTHVQGAAWLGVILTLQGVYLHSCTRVHLGPLRYIVGDNLFHRIHHSADKHHLDKNFSGFSPLWDIVFRTAYFPRADEWPRTGLADQPEARTISDYLVRPFTGTSPGNSLRSLQRQRHSG